MISGIAAAAVQAGREANSLRSSAHQDNPAPAGTQVRALPVGYNLGFSCKEITMEAERLNSLSNLLTDLTNREVELRRYL